MAWDGLWMVLSLGGIMALASFLAGAIPLSFSLSGRQTRLLSAIGTGLLVGTALIVIIPEGIETMYSASESSSRITAASQQSKGLFDIMEDLAKHGVGPHQQSNEAAGRAEELAHLNGRAVNYAVAAMMRRATKTSAKAPVQKDDHEETSAHAWIGIALITGFILMYLIDALSSAPSIPHTHHTHIPLSQIDPSSEEDTEAGPTPSKPSFEAPIHKPNTKSTTIGLIIHAFADGIALGASSTNTTTQATLGLIVFIAVMVHKAPAAFGLTSVLLKLGLSKRAARGHLLLFSLAAPLGALVTWAFVNLLGKAGSASGSAPGSSTWWTGLVLVFSGGTFLYVAMHALQEGGSGLGSAGGGRRSRGEVMLTTMGMLLPLLTQIGHAHAHGG